MCLSVNYHPSDGIISVLSANYHPSDGVIIVLSANYHPSVGVIIVLSANYHPSDGVISALKKAKKIKKKILKNSIFFSFKYNFFFKIRF